MENFVSNDTKWVSLEFFFIKNDFLAGAGILLFKTPARHWQRKSSTW
jgi:hypothetical protein